MTNDWEDEDIPDGIDPKTAPVLVIKRAKPKPAKSGLFHEMSIGGHNGQ